TLRVAAGVRVACVDGLRQGRRGAVARGLVGAGGKPLQLRELDDVWPVDPYAVLPVLLRPVERAVRETDELVTAVPLQWERREPGARGDVADVVEVEGRDPLDDRVRSDERRPPVVVLEQQCELVAAEAERLAALAQPPGHLREDAVARRVAEAVVDLLEVVD